MLPTKNTTQQRTTNNAVKNTGKAPDFRVCTATKNGENTYWTQIGAGWTTDKGNMSIKLSALPLTGDIMIFHNDNKETQ